MTVVRAWRIEVEETMPLLQKDPVKRVTRRTLGLILVDCVSFTNVVRMGIVFARFALIVQHKAVRIAPGACCACAQRNGGYGQARREIEMNEASGAWHIRSTSFRARLSDVHQSFVSVDRCSTPAENLQSVLDLLLPVVRGVHYSGKD